jgi:hypothetical protein
MVWERGRSNVTAEARSIVTGHNAFTGVSRVYHGDAIEQRRMFANQAATVTISAWHRIRWF